jgi:CubicO group peptidase (beta-lactamase class C family)
MTRMTPSRAHLPRIATALALLAGPALAAGPAPEARARARLEALWQSNQVPGISAAVASRGRIVFSGGVGFADLDNLVPATAITVYNIGSVSKPNAAVAVMQLLEQGKIALDDHIQKYVPTFPDKGHPITIKHLMTHRSGIRHYRDTDFADTPGDENMKPFASLQEAIKLFKDDPLLYRPGEFSSYSSYATNLLQGVIETASGVPFEEYMRANVWGPAGMLSTAFDVPERVVPHRARSYRHANGRTTNNPYGDVTYKFAGGGMISTAEDLVRLCVALNQGRLLKPDTIVSMYDARLEPVRAYSENGPPYRMDPRRGLIWVVETENGRTVVSHGGSVKGFYACLVNYPEENVAAAILYNAAGPATCDQAKTLAGFFLPVPGGRP